MRTEPRNRRPMPAAQALLIVIGLLATLTGLGSLIAWAVGGDRFLIVATITGTIGVLSLAAGSVTVPRRHG